MSPPNGRTRWCRLLATSLSLTVLMLGFTGCRLMRPSASQPRAEIKSLQAPAKKPTGSDSITILQLQVMRFADLYATKVAQACDDFSASVGTPDARLDALRWKLGQSTSAFINASDPNPQLNALDLLVLATLSRMVVEDHYVKKYGDAAQPWLETHRDLETDAWALARSELKPNQQQELRDMIQEWRRKNPNQRTSAPSASRNLPPPWARCPSRAQPRPIAFLVCSSSIRWPVLIPQPPLSSKPACWANAPCTTASACPRS